MKRSLYLGLVLSAAIVGGGGCSHIPFIGKKKPAEKQSKHIATDTELEFQGRWVDHRVGDLVSQGQSPEAAQAQALKEFYAQFPATTIAQKQQAK